MKKFLAILLAAVFMCTMVFGLTACSKPTSDPDSDGGGDIVIDPNDSDTTTTTEVLNPDATTTTVSGDGKGTKTKATTTTTTKQGTPSTGNLTTEGKELKIRVFDGGYGYQWLVPVANAFSKKTGVKVSIAPTKLRNQIQADLMVEQASDQKYDLYFTDYGGVFGLADKGKFVDITDVYNYKNSGESKTISEKLHPYIRDTYKINGKYYFLNWGVSIYGIVYNVDMLKGYTLPRTTDELIALCEQLKAKNISSFIFGNDTNYWDEVFLSWWAQYSGVDAFKSFFNGKVLGQNQYSSKIFEEVGRLRSLEAVQACLWYPNGYIHPSSTGYDFMSAQRNFLNGRAAMMINGGWLENEMSQIFPDGMPIDIAMMPMPIISSIREKLSTVKDDATLIKVVDYVDGKGDKPAGVSDADIETVKKARNIQTLTGYGDTATIPVTAKNKENAKSFLRYFYSDEAIRSYMLSASGSQLPVVGYDFENDAQIKAKYTPLQLYSVATLMKKDVYSMPYTDLVNKGGLSYKKSASTLETYFGSQRDGDRHDAKWVYDYDINYYSANNGAMWKTLLSNSGIK